MKQIFLTLALVLGFAFPAMADEATIRQVEARYQTQLRQIAADWESATSYSLSDDKDFIVAFAEYLEVQLAALRELQAADYELYTAVLEASYLDDNSRIDKLYNEHEPVRTFFDQQNDALAELNAIVRSFDEVDAVRRSIADQLRTALEEAAHEAYIADLVALTN